MPLPVVNDDGHVFPTIFPYVDFDQPRYYRDPATHFFVPNNNPNAQAELWHSLIDLGSQSEDYLVFFQKLKAYHANPTAYVGDKIRYDDFVDQKESYNPLMLPSYLNNFTFAEDLAYHRYNPLLIDLLNAREQGKLEAQIQQDNGIDDPALSAADDLLDGYMTEFLESSQNTAQQVPTLFVAQTLQ